MFDWILNTPLQAQITIQIVIQIDRVSSLEYGGSVFKTQENILNGASYKNS